MTEPTARKIQRYGWVPDLPDTRDHLFVTRNELLSNLPPSVDLRPGCPPVYDQGQLGSCTANAIGAAFEYELKKQNAADFTPARLFIYYNERVMEGSVGTDSGAQIRDGVKSIANQGVCSEADLPYDITKFTEKPSDQCYQDALNHQATQYQRIPQDLNLLKSCLAGGSPFVFGFSVYESFEGPAVAQSGDAPMPTDDEKLLGGHAVMAVGYDDTTQRFLVRNSWGDGWGKAGYFTLPYEYVTDDGLASDFWSITLVEG